MSRELQVDVLAARVGATRLPAPCRRWGSCPAHCAGSAAAIARGGGETGSNRNTPLRWWPPGAAPSHPVRLVLPRPAPSTSTADFTQVVAEFLAMGVQDDLEVPGLQRLGRSSPGLTVTVTPCSCSCARASGGRARRESATSRGCAASRGGKRQCDTRCVPCCSSRRLLTKACQGKPRPRSRSSGGRMRSARAAGRTAASARM